jgi:hypothetical protein
MIESTLEIQKREDISDGDLNSFQSLRFDGPHGPERDLSAVLRFMEESHIRSIQLSSFGALFVRESEGFIGCRIFGVWPALSFRETETITESRRQVRRYEIGCGVLSRAGETDCGTLEIGAEIESAEGSRLRWRIWSEVSGYPSRFLKPPPASPIFRVIGPLYAAYHRRATIWFLKKTARRLQRGEVA